MIARLWFYAILGALCAIYGGALSAIGNFYGPALCGVGGFLIGRVLTRATRAERDAGRGKSRFEIGA